MFLAALSWSLHVQCLCHTLPLRSTGPRPGLGRKECALCSTSGVLLLASACVLPGLGQAAARYLEATSRSIQTAEMLLPVLGWH